MTDPIRYPKIVMSYEKEFKQNYLKMQENMAKQIVSELMK